MAGASAGSARWPAAARAAERHAGPMAADSSRDTGPDTPPDVVPGKAGRFADLKLRIITGAAAAAVGLGLMWLGGVWAMLLIALVSGLMMTEFRAITLQSGADRSRTEVPILIGGVVGGVAVAHFYGFPVALRWLVWSLVAALIADLVVGRRKAMSWGIIGGAYIGLAAIGLLYLREEEPHGLVTVVWLVIVVAAADVGGYFAGRLIGGPKLWPQVSPKKTWAGAAGGIGLAMFAGGLLSLATAGTHFVAILIVSALAAVISQGGDLAESAFKRHFGVKDSGRLMPGHGGALDRFDGLMAAALAAALVTWWRGQSVLIW